MKNGPNQASQCRAVLVARYVPVVGPGRCDAASRTPPVEPQPPGWRHGHHGAGRRDHLGNFTLLHDIFLAAIG